MSSAINQISIDGKPYRIADESLVGSGRRTYTETMRPSQPSEATINTRTWRLSGPIGNSRQAHADALLGVDYTTTLDTRNEGLLTSAGAKIAIALSGGTIPRKVAPTSTISTSAWAPGPISSGPDAHDDLDTYDSPNDETYWKTAVADDELTLGLAEQIDPGVDTGHVVRARITAPAGNADTVGVKLRLYDGASIVATSDEFTIDPIKTVTLINGTWTTGAGELPDHPAGSGVNRMLLLVLTGDDAIGANFNRAVAVTYGEQAMTKYGQVETQFADAGDRRVEIWYLLESGVDAATSTELDITWTETNPPDHGWAASLATFANVNQLSPISDDAADKDKQSLTMSGLVVEQGNFVVAGAVNGRSTPSSWTPQSGFTERLDAHVFDSMHHVQDKQITADGTESVSATLAASDSRGAGFAIVIQGQGNASDRIENFEYPIPSSTIATLGSYASLRNSVVASTLTGADEVYVTEMQFELPKLDVQNVSHIDEQDGQLFIHRGSKTSQVNPGDMSEVGSPEDHGATITDTIASWQGAGYVCFGPGTPVQKRTGVSAAGATYDPVAGSPEALHMAVGPDRLWVVDAKSSSLDVGKVRFVVDELTDTNQSNGIQVADRNSGHVTGLYTLGEFMVAGTLRGPRSFTDAGAPAVLGEAVDAFPDELNGANGASLWGWHYHATKLGLYAVQPVGPVENPVGPGEGLAGQAFEGPIDGYPIALRAFKDSLWVSYLSSEGDSWLLRGIYGPQTAGTGRPEWFVFRRLAGVRCEAIGATTGRNVPAVVWGEGQQPYFTDLAFRGREIADSTNYRFAIDGGEWHGTTLMLTQGLIANVRWAKFFTENCNTTNTWQLALAANEGEYIDVGSAVTTNGLQTVRPTGSEPNAPLTNVSFTTLKPRLTQIASSNALPPQIRGDLVIAFDERPEHVREVDVLIELTQEGELAVLQGLVGTAHPTPVAVRLPQSSDVNIDRWAFVRAADVYDRAGPDDDVALVKLVVWPTT